MLKKETINLLKSNDADFKNIFSICIGKSFLVQKRLIEYLGIHKRWATNLKEGLLKINENVFNVEYIGTTSVKDHYWYSSEVERQIPDEHRGLMAETRKYMESLNLNELTQSKITLEGDINGYNLSMIYIAFAQQNVAFYCGSGATNIYMYVKNLPNEIFKKMDSTEFSTHIKEIVSAFNVNHKLMVKALLTENEIEYEETEDSIIAKFDEDTFITVRLNENGLIENYSKKLSL